ncbi:MAG TPA: phospholipid carrier-dependent glycosyltransferase [bacterium]|nr:phospholipid carrier-dependent glycosyltransferase [bacterium]
MRSTPTPFPRPWVIFFFFALLFSAQVLPRLASDSPAGDEMIEMGDGFFYWKGDVLSAAEHPPLAKGLQALPLWALGVPYRSEQSFHVYLQRDYHFLFVLNADRWPLLFELSRGVTFLFGLGLGLLLFGAARGGSPGLLASVLALWAFEPSILAFSGFVLADIPMTFFFTAAVIAFHKAQADPSPRRSALAGLLAAMAVTCKFSAVFLLPVFLVLEVLASWKRGPAWRGIWARWGWGTIAGLAWILALYLPGTLFITGHPWPLGLLFNGLHSITASLGRAVYFRGEISVHPFPLYNPTALLIKSPLPLLILLAVAVFLAVKGKIRLPAWQWVPPLVFFLLVAPVYDLGIRNLLPLYPFFILMAGRAAGWMWDQKPRGERVFPLLAGGLLLFQVFSVGLSYPYQTGYFNELVAPSRRLYWLGDSNLDIGQNTRRMVAEAKKRGWTHVKLAQFGSLNPVFYGLPWSPWTEKDLQGPQPGWVYLVSAEFLQLGPAYLPQAPLISRGWFNQVPRGLLADTWYYYEAPGEVQADNSPAIQSVF